MVRACVRASRPACARPHLPADATSLGRRAHRVVVVLGDDGGVALHPEEPRQAKEGLAPLRG